MTDAQRITHALGGRWWPSGYVSVRCPAFGALPERIWARGGPRAARAPAHRGGEGRA